MSVERLTGGELAAVRADTAQHLANETGCGSCAQNVLRLLDHLEAAEQKVADLRLISNANGDWTARSADLHLRAAVLEGSLRATVEALVEWNGIGDDEHSLVLAAVIRNAQAVLEGRLSLGDEMVIVSQLQERAEASR